MTDKPLHTKYRPKTFDEVIGNKATIESLKFKIKEKSTTTFLFHGERGSNKTTFSRIVAKELGAGGEIHEMDVGDTRGIDAGRNIKNKMILAPMGGARAFILDEVQQATKDFFGTLLKVLEEPPKNNYFLLCTTDPQKLPKAIKSRCTMYQTEELRTSQIVKLLKSVLEKEGKELSDEAVKLIASNTEGIPREALVLLDKVIGMDNERSILKVIKAHSIGEDATEIIELCRALLKEQDYGRVVKILNKVKHDPEKVRISIRGFMTSVLKKGPNDLAAYLSMQFSKPYFHDGKDSLYLDCYQACSSE